ncbi:Sensor protein cutS [[Actinomadura] parvosata subsp. kistnae]|nr:MULTISPECIES: HAMP domain-containing sensor histidine kinase [unclassified Nonomuraea]NJP98159.1 HAMP domain-containing histidine kinase [Nonomuraea sp. FMUSA5-5]SPL92162.1 Sensor protein cutS [Actinomadura parvosata subsp. kistnae]
MLASLRFITSPRTVRLRLTLLYGVLFAASSAVLLTITFLLVWNSRRNAASLRYGTLEPGRQGPIPPLSVAEQAREYVQRQNEALIQDLLIQSMIAFAIMTIISFAIGWLISGRVLRPLRTMNDTIRRISARNIHERLALQGPRDELRNLADTVDGLLGRLHAALDAHKHFVANAAHELRTPLTVEHALLEEALLDAGADADSLRSTMGRLLSISEQQGRLLESLLTLAESEGGLAHRQPVDLAAVADRVVRATAAGDLRLLPALSPALASGDPALIERLVANLVDNAVRYNVPGGRVEVTTGVTDGWAVVSVLNTGPVIPPDQVERLLEPFQRLDRTVRGNGHHGLGLSIVRAIAAAHDALLSALARPDGGLSVRVSFPLATGLAARNGA